jgi:predicted nucleic acid-binding protein
VPRIVLDTDVASLSYKGWLPAALAARLAGHEICVTFVTVGELARWAEKRHWGTRARTELVTWLGRRVILPYDGADGMDPRGPKRTRNQRRQSCRPLQLTAVRSA